MKTALITGATGGIGGKTAEYEVIVTGIDEAGRDTVMSNLESKGIKAHFYKCDATSEEQVNETFAKIAEKFDHLDLLVNNVGGLGGRVEERSFFDVAKRDFENRQAVNFAVRLDGKLIGEAVLNRFDCRGGAELGCRIDKAYAGNGYGTEAFRAAAEWGLYQVNLNRVVAKCYRENEASYKMLSACMRRSGEDETFFYFEKLV